MIKSPCRRIKSAMWRLVGQEWDWRQNHAVRREPLVWLLIHCQYFYYWIFIFVHSTQIYWCHAEYWTNCLKILKETTHHPYLGVICSVLFVLNKSFLEFQAFLVYLPFHLSHSISVLVCKNELVCVYFACRHDFTVPVITPSSQPSSLQSAKF